MKKIGLIVAFALLSLSVFAGCDVQQPKERSLMVISPVAVSTNI